MTYNQPPIDRGWAWVIMVSHSLSTMILALYYASGIFNATFLEIYGKSKSVTAWCGSMHAGMFYFAGIPAGILTDYLGARCTIIIGGFVSTIGFVLTYFSTSFIYTFITYGFIAGTGFGMVYVPCLTTVGVYFNKHRVMAYGVVTMGAGFCWITLTPAVEYICSEYGWRAAMIFMGGVTIHFTIIGALTRPIDLSRLSSNNYNSGDSCVLKINNQSINDICKSRLDEPIAKSLPNLCIQSKDKNQLKYIMQNSDQNGIAQSLDNVRNADHAKAQNGNVRPGPKGFPSNGTVGTVGNVLLVGSCGSLVKMNDLHCQTTHETFSKENLKQSDGNGSALCGKYFPLMQIQFAVFLVNTLCIYIGQGIFYIHFPAFIKSFGTSSYHLSIILACMGVTTIISRFASGLFAAKSKLDVCWLYIISCVLTGIVLIFGPVMAKTYPGQVLLGMSFTLFVNVTVPLAVPIVIQLLGVELVNMSTGIITFMGGFGFMFAPPFAGLLYDLSGSYHTSFYTAGAIMIIGAIVMIPLAMFFNRRRS